MKTRFTRIRPLDMTDNEKRFDKDLQDNGFEVLGIRNYKSKMDFDIVKDNKEFIYSVHKGNIEYDAIWNCFTDYCNTCITGR